MNTAEVLRYLREERHLSQEKVAEDLGLSRTTYVKYENGNSVRRHLQDLADYFAVSTDFLLGRSKKLSLTREADMAAKLTLKSSEIQHIKKYRALSSEYRGAIDSLLEYFAALNAT